MVSQEPERVERGKNKQAGKRGEVPYHLLLGGGASVVQAPPIPFLSFPPSSQGPLGALSQGCSSTVQNYTERGQSSLSG